MRRTAASAPARAQHRGSARSLDSCPARKTECPSNMTASRAAAHKAGASALGAALQEHTCQQCAASTRRRTTPAASRSTTAFQAPWTRAAHYITRAPLPTHVHTIQNKSITPHKLRTSASVVSSSAPYRYVALTILREIARRRLPRRRYQHAYVKLIFVVCAGFRPMTAHAASNVSSQLPAEAVTTRVRNKSCD